MIGTKCDYLATSSENDPVILGKIFGELDGKALYLISTAQGKYSLKKGVIYQDFFTGKTNIELDVSSDIKRASQAKQGM